MSVTKPPLIHLPKVTANLRELLKASVKASIHVATGQLTEASTDVADLVTALELQQKPGELAWLLLSRGMTAAVGDLCGEAADQFPQTPESAAEDLATAIEEELEAASLTVDSELFDRPADSAFAIGMTDRLRARLESFGFREANARAVSVRLRSYYAYSLVHEWRQNPAVYQRIQDEVQTPFDSAHKREQQWLQYNHWLQREFDRPVFDENFGLRQIFVPLRACWEEKNDDSSEQDGFEADMEEPRPGIHHRSTRRHVNWLEELLQHWLEKNDKDDPLRILSGDPGSGKSTVARWFAAEQAGARSDRRTVVVPLHHFTPRGDFKQSLHAYCEARTLLPDSILDEEQRLLLIFDGLDEVAKQGRVGAETAADFMEELRNFLSITNSDGLRLQVLVTGRPVAVQSLRSRFERSGEVMYLLPYHISDHSDRQFEDPHGLLTGEHSDQRDEWWRRYAAAKGRDDEGLPEELRNKGRELDEITAQPLLNYLVALSLERGEVDFSSDVNLNDIYDDLLRAVYERKYENQPSRTVEGIERADFTRLLEEIALAAWHGNGRTASVREIRDYCERHGLGRQLSQLASDAGTGVTRLLTAFYFQQSGRRDDGDETFEFTHKSFGEYLTARRILRQLKSISTELHRRREDPDVGWDEREALIRWVAVCGPTTIDRDLAVFIRREVATLDAARVAEWQSSIVSLIDFLLRRDMPMESCSGVTSYRNMSRQSRNAEEALLVAHAACAAVTGDVSQIDWPEATSAGSWIRRLSGQRLGSTNTETLNSLSNICFDSQRLHCLDLFEADLTGSSFCRAMASLIILRSAQLPRTDWTDASIPMSNFRGAMLEDATLAHADCNEADFTGAWLPRADLRNAYCDNSVFEDATLVDGRLQHSEFGMANLEGANLKGANLREADLRQVILRNASLEGADLSGAKLSDADLRNSAVTPAQIEQAGDTDDLLLT